MKTPRKHAVHLLGGAALAAALVAAVMLLWNALIPAITGWTAIGYWQALGLVALCRLLSGHGIGPALSARHRRLHERLHGMTHEERHRFIRDRIRSLVEEDRPAAGHGPQ